MSVETRLQSLQELIDLHCQVNGELKGLEEQFPVQAGAARAAAEFERFLPNCSQPIRQLPIYGPPSITWDEYQRIFETLGHSRNQREEKAFKLIFTALKFLEDFASRSNNLEDLGIFATQFIRFEFEEQC